MRPPTWKLPASALVAACCVNPASAFYFPTLGGVPMPRPTPSVIQPGQASPVKVEIVDAAAPGLPPAIPLDGGSVVPPPILPPPGTETPSVPPEVPEPATITLAVVGIAAVALKRRRIGR